MRRIHELIEELLTVGVLPRILGSRLSHTHSRFLFVDSFAVRNIDKSSSGQSIPASRGAVQLHAILEGSIEHHVVHGISVVFGGRLRDGGNGALQTERDAETFPRVHYAVEYLDLHLRVWR